MNVATNLAELINKTTNHSQTQRSIWCASVSTNSTWLIQPLCKVQSIPGVALPFPAQLIITSCNAAFFSPSTSLHAGAITGAAASPLPSSLTLKWLTHVQWKILLMHFLEWQIVLVLLVLATANSLFCSGDDVDNASPPIHLYPSLASQQRH